MHLLIGSGCYSWKLILHFLTDGRVAQLMENDRRCFVITFRVTAQRAYSEFMQLAIRFSFANSPSKKCESSAVLAFFVQTNEPVTSHRELKILNRHPDTLTAGADIGNTLMLKLITAADRPEQSQLILLYGMSVYTRL